MKNRSYLDIGDIVKLIFIVVFGWVLIFIWVSEIYKNKRYKVVFRFDNKE